MLWEAWTLGQAWGTRPSELYCIRDEVDAYCFDRAVHLFGSTVQGELDVARKGAKSNAQAMNRQRAVMAKYMQVERKFRDPAASGQAGSTTTTPGEIVKL